jgi:pectate lyase
VNNLFNSSVAAQCVMAGFEADLLVESNVFENVAKPIDKMDNNFTAITVRNNTFTNTTADTTGSGTAFTPPYSLTVTPVANVKSQVMAGAGATLTSADCSTPTTYTLTTAASPTAGGTVSGAGTYNSGTVVTLTATPATGYTFTGWSGDASGTSTSVNVTMSSNKAVTANFQAQSSGGGSTIRIEDNATTAQGLCSYEGSISSNSGANNGMVINLSNSTAKGINWKVNAAAAGTYTLTWRYVNSSSSNVYTMALLVNGSTVNSAQAFAKTSSSTTFSTSTATVSLNAGGNTIRLQSVSSTATADIDWMEVTGNAPSAGDCNAARTATGSVSVDQAQLLNQQLTGVFPNPAKGKAIISVTLGTNEQAGIRVYDALGRLVDNLGSIKSVTGGTQQVSFNLNNKKPGVYNVVVTGNKGLKTTYKLLVQ